MSSQDRDILSRLRARAEDELETVTTYLKQRSKVFKELMQVQDEIIQVTFPSRFNPTT